MADVKISALPLASTPLTGTEVLPIVQSATTDQVTVANLTAGRAVSASSLTLTSTPLAVGSGGTGLSSFTAGSVPYASSTSALSFSSNLFSNGTNIGIGITPSYKLHVLSDGAIAVFNSSSSNANTFVQVSSVTGSATFGIDTDNNAYYYTPAAIKLFPGGTEKARIDASGNLLIGTTSLPYTSDKLTVSGGLMYLNKTTIINSTSAVSIANAGTGFAFMRDQSTGGSALVIFEYGTATIVSQIGTVFVTTAPSANQIQITHALTTGYNLLALAGSSRNGASLGVSCITTQ